jgi:hypothetical protein
VALPLAVVFVSVVVWVVAASRSGFWADDFLNLTHFYHSLGHLSDNHINTGKYIINVFWALGTELFGTASSAPFLALDCLVFIAGLVIWLRVGTRTRWTGVSAWWVAGVFLATSVWIETALWATNITHAGGFLFLGLSFWAHERCLDARTPRHALVWSLGGGLGWTLAVLSNLIYIGLVPLALYCAWQQFGKLRRLGVGANRAAIGTACWNLLLPLFYFFAVAYPGTTSSRPYATNGLRFISKNFDYYRTQLAPSTFLLIVYIALIGLAVAGAVVEARRRNWFSLAVLASAGATSVPVLVQGQARFLHYAAMPLLLLFSSLAASWRPRAERGAARTGIKAGVLAGAAIVLIAVFIQGSVMRSNWIDDPYGRILLGFRSQVANVTGPGSLICAHLPTDPVQRNFFIAATSGSDGFRVPPIGASQAILAYPGQACPPASTQIAVSTNARGDFVAVRRR